jgi:hypothetical protein
MRKSLCPFSLAVAIIFGLSGTTKAAWVGFTEVPPDPPPSPPNPNLVAFAIRPSAPTQDDVIGFYEPFDQAISFDCYLDIQRLGTPRLAVDRDARLVEIIVEPWQSPGGVEGCASVVSGYLTGLTGEFGPLEPGQWEYQGWSGRVEHFTVVPEPSFIGANAIALVAMLRARRRRVPRPFAQRLLQRGELL